MAGESHAVEEFVALAVADARRPVGTQHAQRSGGQLEGPAVFHAPAVNECVGQQDVAQGQRDLVRALPVGAEDRRGAVDQRLIGRIRDEAPDEFLADELGDTRMAGQPVEDVAAVLHRRLFGIEELAQHEFRAGIVPGLPVHEGAVVFGRVLPMAVLDRPAGERRCGFVHVHIGVADRIAGVFGAGRYLERVDKAEIVFGAEGVQLQQFPREIFVGAGARVRGVVEVVHHRRALRDGLQHRPEIAQRIRADHVAVVVHEHRAGIEIGGHHVEMVVPETDHHFLQLPLGVHGTDQRRALRLPGGAHAHVVDGVRCDVVGPQLGEALAQGGVAGIRQAGFDRAVVDCTGVELLVDKGGQTRGVVRAKRIEFGNGCGRCAEGQMIERPHCEGCALKRDQVRPGNGSRRRACHARAADGRIGCGGKGGCCSTRSGRFGQTGRRGFEAKRAGKAVTARDHTVHRFAAGIPDQSCHYSTPMSCTSEGSRSTIGLNCSTVRAFCAFKP